MLLQPPTLTACIRQIQTLLQAGDAANARHALAEARKQYGASWALRELALLLTPHWQCTRVGRRVQLRQPNEHDTPFLLACMGDDGFMSQFHPTAPRQRSADAMTRALAQSKLSMPKFKAQHWLIERLPPFAGAPAADGEHGSTQPLGLLSVVDLVTAHERAELLVGIKDPRNRGVGLATEATLLALDVCFNHIGLQKLTSMVLATNPLSQRSTQALGFVAEGYRKAHFRLPQTDEFVDCHDNGLTVSAFRQSARLARLSMRLLGRNIVLPLRS